MSEVLPLASRQGLVEQQFAVAPHNTQMVVAAQFAGVVSGSFKFLIEQRLPGNDWSVVGGADVPNIDGVTSLAWRFSEQIVDDPNGWESERDVVIAGKTFRQLTLRPVQRITIESSVAIEYSIDVIVANVAPPAAQMNIQAGN